MEMVLYVVLLVVGGAVGAMIMRQRGLREVQRLEVELNSERARLEAFRQATEQARQDEAARTKAAEDAFASIARKALAQTNEDFSREAGKDLEQRRLAIENLLKPLKEQLDKLEKGHRELEGKREQAYGGLVERLAHLQDATSDLTRHSRSLATALKGSSQARGRWGEITLRNLAELAGMAPHCDFSEQQTLGNQRPDMVVRLPGDGAIPVDAKVPCSSYLKAAEAEGPDERLQLLKSHANDVRQHVRALAKKDYSAAVNGRIDFTVMFVPADPILTAAFEHAPDLQDEALRSRVLIATPVTLIALLRTVGIYWQQDAEAENARKVWEAVREFRDRVGIFVGHMEGVGKGLSSALDSYNRAVGSYERRVLPSARRVEELEDPSGSSKPLPTVKPVEESPRTLTGGE